MEEFILTIGGFIILAGLVWRFLLQPTAAFYSDIWADLVLPIIGLLALSPFILKLFAKIYSFIERALRHRFGDEDFFKYKPFLLAALVLFGAYALRETPQGITDAALKLADRDYLLIPKEDIEALGAADQHALSALKVKAAHDHRQMLMMIFMYKNELRREELSEEDRKLWDQIENGSLSASELERWDKLFEKEDAYRRKHPDTTGSDG